MEAGIALLIIGALCWWLGGVLDRRQRAAWDRELDEKYERIQEEFDRTGRLPW